MDFQAKGGKSRIIRDVVAETGFSYRKTGKAVNAVFDILGRALAQGREIETPLGTFRVRTRRGKAHAKFKTTYDISKNRPKYRLHHFPGAHRVVKFVPDQNLDLGWVMMMPRPSKQELEVQRIQQEMALEEQRRAELRADLSMRRLEVLARSIASISDPAWTQRWRR
jgi:nucleoid DNA-binding protein